MIIKYDKCHNSNNNVKKKGRVQHLPDSRLWTSSQWREPTEKIKCKMELSTNTVASLQ